MRWQLPILVLMLAASQASAADSRFEIVWVSVLITPQNVGLCPSVPSHVPDVLARPAMEAVSGRSYAHVLKSKLAIEGRTSRAALRRLPIPSGAVTGTVAVRLDEVAARPGEFTVTGMQLIGEKDPTATEYDVVFDAVLDASGAVVSATPEEKPPAEIERIARSALDEVRFDRTSDDDAVRNTQVTVTLLLQNAGSGDMDVAVGPVRKGPRPMTIVAPKYPGPQQRRGNTGWVMVEYDTDASGAVVNARVVCAEPPGVFDKVSLQAVEDFRYEPERVNGIAVPSKGLRNRFTFSME